MTPYKLTDATRFQQYAQDCKRMAETMSGEQMAKMLEIAKAWEQCAEVIQREASLQDQTKA